MWMFGLTELNHKSFSLRVKRVVIDTNTHWNEDIFCSWKQRLYNHFVDAQIPPKVLVCSHHLPFASRMISADISTSFLITFFVKALHTGSNANGAGGRTQDAVIQVQQYPDAIRGDKSAYIPSPKYSWWRKEEKLELQDNPLTASGVCM